MGLWLGLMLVLMFASLPQRAAAVAPNALETRIDTMVRPYIEGKKVVGLSIGVINGREQLVLGYGSTDHQAQTLPDGDTVFEIGSISKVFTGLLLAIAAERGELDISDPAATLLNNHVRLKHARKQPVTLVDLASHTSGLPRLPANHDPQDWDNPYSGYSVDRLYDYLEGRRLDHKKNVDVAYSNLGVGLLGHLLELAADESYESLLVERICQPLGLDDTRITLSEEMSSRLASPYEKYGKRAKNWDLDSMVGAGGIRSTTNDMLRFLVAQMKAEIVTAEPVDAQLAVAMRASHQVQRRINDKVGVALAWHVAQEGPDTILVHNGQTGGYHAFVAFVNGSQKGLVVLCNTAKDIDALGRDIMEVLREQE